MRSNRTRGAIVIFVRRTDFTRFTVRRPVNQPKFGVTEIRKRHSCGARKTETMNQENLGPAERIINTVLAYTDHAVHNRPGMVTADASSVVGVKWVPVTHKEEDGQKVVYQLTKSGRKTVKVKLGSLWADNTIRTEDRRKVGDYRPAGLFPEVTAWMYRQVVEVWKLDNEFSAKWASYAFAQEHKDLKVILAALMLVQSRKGDPVKDGDTIAFYDEDYRDVGEAMALVLRKDGRDLNAKMLLRIHDVLSLPQVAEINRELGFGKSARHPFLGRWTKVVEKWLEYRETNPKMFEGLVKAGFRTKVMELARRVGYKPRTNKFFETLRWKQSQSKDGRRTLAIGQEMKAAEDWNALTEEQICEKIVKEKPGFKRIVGLVPKNVGITRAIVAAAIEAKALSDKDLIIATPTLEELGLLKVQEIKERWEKAMKNADDMRAANIATRVRNKETKEKLQGAADIAVQKAVEEVVKGVRVYFMVDISGSMENAIVQAKSHVAKFLQGFPQDKVHVSVFNTSGREVPIKHSSAVGVENAFRGISAGGGTDYGAGVKVLKHHKPAADEDVLFIFVGDEEAGAFAHDVQASGLNPMAFGFVKVRNNPHYRAVQDTADQLKIPCFMIDEKTFEDPYAIPRTIRALVASTPVGKSVGNVVHQRVSLAETILNTEILKKPAWAA